MIRDPHCKSSRRTGWAALAVFLFALPTAANAQGLFFLFGNPSPDEIERRLAASGYEVTGPLLLRGDVYLADVVVRGEGPERLIIDPQSGRVLQRFRTHGDRWREAAEPPDAWGDDPRLWNGPRPPADVGPGAPPPDQWVPPGPSVPVVVETPKAAPKKVEIKPRLAPVANIANPPAVQLTPAAAPKPAAPALAKPAAEPTPAASATPSPASASPTPSAAAATPSAAAANPSPAAAPSPAPSMQAAKADSLSAPVKPPAAAPTLPAPAKTKSVNDIPVTPLD